MSNAGKILIGVCCALALNTYSLAQPSLGCANFNEAVPATTAHLVDNANGTVSDFKTGLIWKKCSEGQTYNSGDNSCSGSATGFNWQQALQRAQDVNEGISGENLSESDWRVPNIKELASIVEQECWNPSINVSVFPSTPSSGYWSSSPVAYDSNSAWYVGFDFGYGNTDVKHDLYYVRLVRSGQ